MLIDKEKHSIKKSILRIGEVSEVKGQAVTVIVDNLKNTPDLFYNGELIKNVSVGSYIEIRKGFLSLIGKIDGEKIVEKYNSENQRILQRELMVSLTGSINPLKGNHFEGGLKELPMIGNEAFIVTTPLLSKIHDLNKSNNDFTISIGNTAIEGLPVLIGIDKLFSSHIAIFGNTGSGKSNTLAKLYSSLMNNIKIKDNSKFKEKCKFILFDFNGEYSSDDCICTNKKVYKLSTRTSTNFTNKKMPLPEDILLDYNVVSIISEATDKTQKPFIKRALEFYTYLNKEDDSHIKHILKQFVKNFFMLTEREKAGYIKDYFKNILPQEFDENQLPIEIDSDICWYGSEVKKYKYMPDDTFINSIECPTITKTILYKRIDDFRFENDIFSRIIQILYIQLISDILTNRANNEHIAPVINRLKSIQNDLNKIIDSSEDANIFEDSNFVVLDLKNINLKMKKIIPLILCKYVYDNHKELKNGNLYLNIIIDEAHNILSSDSFRESESWKDYRLETFEEIIKEGRKFGTYITISSQRPSDISPTIISQAHNFFIHRLVNQEDLKAIATSVSYIDKLTLESIPTLPVGTCIFNGISTQMPILISVEKLGFDKAPNSETVCISKLLE